MNKKSRGPGRPAKHSKEKKKAISVTLSPEAWFRLSKMSRGLRSEFISKLILSQLS